MDREVLFAVDSIKHIDSEQYDSEDYMLAKVMFLSTRPNSHEIYISEEVLRKSAPSVLGKWITAEVLCGDCTTHTSQQVICGMVPKEQEVEFVEADDGYIDAYVDCIISKRYAHSYCDIFSEDDNTRSVSIEAKFTTDEYDNAVDFDIKTITTLGKRVNPSVPRADITITRFSEDDAEQYYNGCWSKLKSFARERDKAMAEEKYVNHPIDASKDAVYTGEWDGEQAKRDLVKEKNYTTLAPKVCLRLEKGWEDREVTKLGYPVMGLYDGKWRYSTHALASAKAYAEKNDETEVLNKLDKIYKKLGLDGKEEKMAKEIEFAAVDIGDMWGRLYNAMREARHWDYYIMGIYEQDNKKFAIIYDDAKVLYRLDFSLTEDGLTLADEVIKVKQEFIETDDIKKFAEPENVKDYQLAEVDDNDDDGEVEMSAEEMMAKIAELQADIENRDNIIMDKDTELEELRAFKKAVIDKEMACRVDALMDEIKGFVNDEQFAAFRDEGLACGENEIDAWANKVKATCFSAVKKTVKKGNDGVFTFAAPVAKKNIDKDADIWARLKNKH